MKSLDRFTLISALLSMSASALLIAEEPESMDFTFNGGEREVECFGERIESTLRAEGKYAEFWVANELVYYFPDDVRLNQAMVDSVSEQFDNKIYHEVIENFGTDPMDGNFPDGEENGKVSFFICNSPFGEAGQAAGEKFSAFLSHEVMTDFDLSDGTGSLLLVTHEFTHLVTGHLSPGNTTINMDEGFAELAEFLLYGDEDTLAFDQRSFINAEMGRDSLLNWSPSSSTIYAKFALLMKYLHGQYGIEFIRGMVLGATLENQLKEYDQNVSVDELFRRLAVALTFDIAEQDGGIYDMKAHDFSSLFLDPIEERNSHLLNPDLVAAFGRYILPARGAHMMLLKNHDAAANRFTLEWRQGYREDGPTLSAASYDDADFALILGADLRGTSNATLIFDSYQDMLDDPEYGYSIGFVQVSTNNGLSWQSLANENTINESTSDNDHIQDNLPGLAGNSIEWQVQEYNLSEYAGDEILIQFRYIGDSANRGRPHQWQIDNIRIPEIGFENSCDPDAYAAFITTEQFEERLNGSISNIDFVNATRMEPMWNLVFMSDHSSAPLNKGQESIVLDPVPQYGYNINKNNAIQLDLSSVSNATLKFDHYRHMGQNEEEFGGIGFVQVSSDNGTTWQSLSNEETTDEVGIEQEHILEHLPGIRGISEAWQPIEFDLSEYAGQEILLNFRYMSHFGLMSEGPALGWLIDNIEIPEIGYSNDCSSQDTFFNLGTFGELPNRYSVTLVHQVDGQNEILVLRDPVDFSNPEREKVTEFLASGKTYMVVSFRAEENPNSPTANSAIAYDYNLERAYQFTAESGDFRVETGNQFITFIPLEPGVGSSFVYIELTVNGRYRGSLESRPNVPLILDNVTEEDIITFNYKYSRPGGQGFSEEFFMLQKPIGMESVNGHFNVEVEGTTVTFTPLDTGVGQSFIYINYSINNGPQSSYAVKPDEPYEFKDMKEGDEIKFSYKYSLPNGSQAFSHEFSL